MRDGPGGGATGYAAASAGLNMRITGALTGACFVKRGDNPIHIFFRIRFVGVDMAAGRRLRFPFPPPSLAATEAAADRRRGARVGARAGDGRSGVLCRLIAFS